MPHLVHPELSLDPSPFVASPELIDALAGISTPIICESPQILFCQGESPTGVYVVVAGAVTLTMDSITGERMFSVHSGVGSVLGLPGLIGNQPYSLTAVAEAGSRVGFVQRDVFNNLIASNPALSMRVLEVLAAEVRTARKAIFPA